MFPEVLPLKQLLRVNIDILWKFRILDNSSGSEGIRNAMFWNVLPY